MAPSIECVEEALVTRLDRQNTRGRAQDGPAGNKLSSPH